MNSKECEEQLKSLIEHLLLENKIQQDTIKTQKRVINNLSDRITNAKNRLNSLIIFWKKYNPVDNTMQVEQFNGVINILDGDVDESERNK